ncbi:hypothetical protein Mapa_000305 [Marchantia paleacea]|nr:hypothetical protein Mapa_000305 [Marchantia paleacea]
MAVFIQSRCLFSHHNSVVDLKVPPSSNSGDALWTSVQSAGRTSLQSCESYSPRPVPLAPCSLTLSRAEKRCRAGARACAAEETKEVEDRKSDQRDDSKQKWDVSSNCVTPVFRSPPIKSPSSDSVDDDRIQILFLSEGNICRSVYAEAIFSDLLRQHYLEDLVKCSSKAVRDYNEGESPDPRVVLVAEECGLQLPEGKVSVVFDCASDIVNADLVLVFDKFNASDVLKEVTIYETVDKTSRHTGKVRRMGEFCQTRSIEDIEDPLYGNMGGAEELELLHEVHDQIRDSCEGLVQTILNIKTNSQGSESLRQGLRRSLGDMEALNWLVPPMLSRA